MILLPSALSSFAYNFKMLFIDIQHLFSALEKSCFGFKYLLWVSRGAQDKLEDDQKPKMKSHPNLNNALSTHAHKRLIAASTCGWQRLTSQSLCDLQR